MSQSGDATGLDNPIGYPQDSLLFYTSYLYQQWASRLPHGHAAALSWVMFLVIMACTLR